MNDVGLRPFKEVDEPEGFIKLDWFGGIYPNPNQHDNPLIDCIFTPFTIAPDGRRISNLKTQYHAGFSCSYLPALYVGLDFKNGRPLLVSPGLSYEKILFELDVSALNVVSDCVLTDLFNGDAESRFSGPVSNQMLRFGKRAGLKSLKGKLLATTGEAVRKKLKHTKSLPMEVVIHDMELTRFYLTNSDFSCRNIFNGAFADDRLFINVFNALHEKPGFYKELNAHRLVYRHGYRKEDAPTLARIIFDETALTAAQRVHSSIAADRINMVDGLCGYPKTHFPFQGISQLGIIGRRMKADEDRWIFLAHRIVSCTGKFPFEALSFGDEIMKGGAIAPADAPIAFNNWDTLDSGPVHSEAGEQSGESRNDEKPSASAKNLLAHLAHREFAGLQNDRLKFEKRIDSTYRSQPKIEQYLETLLNASAGSGTTGNSSSAGQRIISKNITPSPLTADLETFIEMIKSLEAMRPAWEIDSLTIDLGVEQGGISCSYFPPVRCSKRKKMNRQFSFLDDAQTIYRKFICLEINTLNGFSYLFEAQRRPSARLQNSKLAWKESLPILLLQATDRAPVAPEAFKRAIELTVVRKTWPTQNELPGMIRHDTVHGLGVQTVNDLASRVMGLIERSFLR